MARRSWRNFDYPLLVTLLLLSAYGVTMIYSATINTLGVESPVQRQILYVVLGTAILLVTASVDYRLLEIVQHPIAVFPPMVLGLVTVGWIIIWHIGQGEVPDGGVLTGAFLAPHLPAMLSGVLAVVVVFLTDRAWIEKLDLVLARLVGILLVAGLIAAAVIFVTRLESERFRTLSPFIIAASVAAAYLLDCLTLRITDILRNPVYVLMLIVLGATFVIGQVAGGAQRWLGAGAVQPSELAKVLVVVSLAKFLSDREAELERFSTVLASLGVVAIPMLLIYLQPDLGTALTLIAIWGAMLWMAGIRFRHLLLLAGAGIAALPLAWFNLQDYMRQRIMLFVNPAGDPDSYFNVYHALVSIGSGGWTGKGLTHGTQSQLHFLRVRHTDFIFAVTAEELGFLGSVAVMGLIVFILWRMFRVAEQSRDTFGRLICAGVAAIILFQSVVNIGMNLGLMPVTGIPLPFFSYGGSSLLTLMVGMGLVESVAMRHKKLEFD
jgi:rod shape determining protein RodA